MAGGGRQCVGRRLSFRFDRFAELLRLVGVTGVRAPLLLQVEPVVEEGGLGPDQHLIRVVRLLPAGDHPLGDIANLEIARLVLLEPG